MTTTPCDPHASPNARALHAQLVAMENAARAGRTPSTILGQHIEAHNELNNPCYGDRRGVTYAGYYYDKVHTVTGKHPGFLEIDVGPGYHAKSWETSDPRAKYAQDAVDFAVDVWKRHRCAVGMSFHQPYPKSPVKDYSATLAENAPNGASPSWFARVVDWRHDTTEYPALLDDLAYLADHLSVFAEQDIPVLLRPYHEMNQSAFWWGDQNPLAFQALWQIIYDYLVAVRNLHNLLFVWAPSCWTLDGPGVPWHYYPSRTPPDIVAVDYYANPDHLGGLRETDVGNLRAHYSALADCNRPRMLAESYYTPVADGGADALSGSPWVIWTVWGDGLTSHNSFSDIKATYHRPGTEGHTFRPSPTW